MLRNGAGMDATDIWRPIQTEVKGLLREYLTSSDPASFAAGNQVSSINDILRDGRSQRDRSKVRRLVSCRCRPH
jgi:exocyst complex component 4